MTSARARAAVAPVDADAGIAARRRIDALTKPVGSLGRIEALAVTLSSIAGRVVDRAYTRKAVLVGAGDHGVVAEGVSAYPADVTPQMVGAFLGGHAAINAFARAVGADVYVANFGVRTELAAHPLLIDALVGFGTANFAHGDAMPAADVERALEAGGAALDEILNRRDYDVLALGEMGIGNTTSAAVLVAALTGGDPAAVTGRGTGVDDAHFRSKLTLVTRVATSLRGASWERIAAAAGGYEIVALAGALVAAAARRIPIVLDGFIVAAAALLAQRIAPNSIGYCIAAHRSQEPGHRVALAALRLEPLLDLNLRLGEGSGAALALPLVEAASRMLAEMQTFAEAGVSNADAS
jgi:nicotinate-nucleotide--dimethylbenzimidazole phosphoribosyltransferase